MMPLQSGGLSFPSRVNCVSSFRSMSVFGRISFFSTFFSRKYWYNLSVNPLWIPLIVAGSGKVWLRAEEAAVYSTGTYCFLDLHPTTILLPYSLGLRLVRLSWFRLFSLFYQQCQQGTLLTKSWTNFGDIFQPGDKWKRFGFRRDLYEILCR